MSVEFALIRIASFELAIIRIIVTRVTSFELFLTFLAQSSVRSLLFEKRLGFSALNGSRNWSSFFSSIT